jgi:hypothetical protein
MSENQLDGDEQSRAQGDGLTSREEPTRSSSRPRGDEWSDVKDPNERRKIQNKLAQRRFRKFHRLVTNVDDRRGANILQETKSESRRRRQNERRKTKNGLAVRMHRLSQAILTLAVNYQDSLGEEYRCDT